MPMPPDWPNPRSLWQWKRLGTCDCHRKRSPNYRKTLGKAKSALPKRVKDGMRRAADRVIKWPHRLTLSKHTSSVTASVSVGLSRQQIWWARSELTNNTGQLLQHLSTHRSSLLCLSSTANQPSCLRMAPLIHHVLHWQLLGLLL